MNLPNQFGSRGAGSIDENSLALLPGMFPKGLVADSNGEPDQRRRYKAKQRIDDENGLRHFRSNPKNGHHGEQDRARKVAQEYEVQVRNTDEPPQASVEPGPIENG